ncbi:MAG: redox-sensing transcriptional repressor rex [Desulfitibacter sp. BRH_c19]|nr:MAG: redox-sensing transcriptional repressor rex [Desulfitibacter sp. BRH_c19]
MKALKIPEATVSRLSVYSRFLFQVDKKGIITISSGDIAQGVGVSPAQVRKDLAYFGEFGTRGVGYNVKDLQYNILKILGLNKQWKVIVIGAGNLGSALGIYAGFKERGFDIVGIFDDNPQKVGFKVNNIEIMSMDRLPKIVKEYKVKMGIITVPSEHAQDVANYLIENNVTSILNFAPRVLNVPKDIIVRNVDLSVNLEILTFNMINQK